MSLTDSSTQNNSDDYRNGIVSAIDSNLEKSNSINSINNQSSIIKAESTSAKFSDSNYNLISEDRIFDDSDSSGALKYIKVKEAWERCVALLKSELDKQIFDAYLSGLCLVDVSSTKSEVTLSAPSKFVCDKVDNLFAENIVNKLSSLLGIEGISLCFRVDTTASESVDDRIYPIRPHVVIKKVSNDRGLALNNTKLLEPRANEEIKHNINSRYTFSNFVVGSSNQFCHAAAQKVAEAPGMAYNPLFIYGGVGLGKTHLLHAIGNKVLTRSPGANVLYLSAESFMNELILGLRRGKMDEFKNKLRNIQVLLIDDIQFIVGKERTQEEFFHTFNALYNAKHQIVITSDSLPQEINNLEDRLKTRFAWGLIADLQAPDFETRAAILQRKAALDSFILPQDVCHWIAERVSSNVRELEGALTRLHAISSLQGSAMTLELADKVLGQMLEPKKVCISIDDIKYAVAHNFGLKVSDLSSKRRTRNLSFPRHIAMYLCRKHTTASYPEIGVNFGGRDHSSVIHAANVVTKKLSTDTDTKAIVDRIESIIAR